MNINHVPDVVISGGEAGCDRGGLEAAKALGICTAGYMSKGFRCEDGKGEEVATEYGLLESSAESLASRDRLNANSCDAAIGFLLTRPKTGRGSPRIE